MNVGGVKVGAQTRVAGVLGWPLGYTRSPAMHNAAYAALGVDAVYLPLPVPPEHFAAAVAGLRAVGFLGANVTVPHKQDAAVVCDVLDDLATAVGAVNTLRVDEGGRLCGHNTDVGGYSDGLDEAGVPRGGPAVVLGAGGAARSVVVALARRGHPVLVVARDVAKAASLHALGAADVQPWGQAAFRTLAAAQLLVDATSAALTAGPAEDAMVASVPLEGLPAGAWVSSLVYHREPRLLTAAKGRGLSVQDGAAMLVHQAARAFTLMTGREAPLEVMRKAFAAAAAG